MAKALRTIAIVAGAVALIATGIGAIGGATFAATALGGTIATIGTWAGVVAGVAGIGAQLLTKPPPARGSVTETIIDVNPPSPYGMGEGYFGGVLRHKVGYGPTLKKVPNPFLFEAVALCVAGPIAGPIVPQVDFGPVTGYYSGWLATDTRLGQRPDTALSAPLQANPTGWSTNHRLSGVAAIAWNHKFDKDGKVYASGLPTRGVVAKWALCYDPRKDSTRPGGSGSHRLGIETTYEWSENPALHAGTYAFGRYVNGKRVIGVGLPDEGIDWEGVAAWANDCQANGWRMFGFVFEGAENDAQRRWQNLRDICIAGGAEPLFSGAVLGFHWHRPRVALDTVTEADLAEGPQEVTAMKSWRDRLNTVRPRYTSPVHNWSLVQAQQVQVASYLAEDGEERAEDIPLNFVKDVDQAAQLAAYWLTNSRELSPITLTLMPRLRAYRPGECLRLQLPELGLDHDAVILRREFDPASMTVTLTLVTEDPAKHAFALGRTGVAPPTPSLTNSAEDRDTITREARAPYWPEVDGPGRPEDGATNTAPANANRVPFSRMEGNRGWGLGFNSHSLTIASIFDVFQGMAYFELEGTATAPGQIVSIAGQPLVANQFRLSPIERVSVSARVLASGAISSWQLALWGTRTDGSTYIIQTLSGGPRNIVDGQVAMFADIPGNVVGGRLELYGTTNAAGAFRLILSEPMLTSSAPGQAIHPPFSPGPNASDGATVGAPNGTPVGGMLAEALVAQAAQAASDATAANAAAFAANTAISVITSDGFLSRDEKPEIRKQRDAIVAEYPTIRARAISFGVAVGNYDADYTALVAYLGGLDLGGSTDTAITRTTFNTVFTDYYAERQTVLDGIAAATSNNLITVNGSGILSGIGTANIIVDNARLPLGSNAVVNSDFTRGKFGWRWRDGGFENDWGVNLPGWFGQRNVMWATQAGTLASNGNNDLYPNAIWAGAGLANAFQFAMPVVHGDRVAVSTLAAQHRCIFQLFILFFDGAGTLITAPATQGGTPGGAANGDPANFTLLTEIANAPANARWAIPMMRMLGTGENNPYIFFTEPMISKVAAGQTVAPRYTPGRVDSLADETATAQRSIVPQFPIIEIRQGQAGHTGNRIVTHTAKRGTTTIGGGTWSIVAQSLGAGSASVNGSTGAVTLSGVVQSGSYTIRYTHTDTVPTDLIVNVTYIPSTASNPAFASGAISNFANSAFVPVTSSLSVVLPGGATSVTLTAASVDIQLFPEAPSPASVAIEMKWQRESSPGTWSDVEAAATSSPGPSVSSPEGFIEVNPGAITCNRTATGLSAGSTQNFRLVARISAGAVRTVIASGTASASA